MNNSQIRDNEHMQLAEKNTWHLPPSVSGETKVKQLHHMLLGAMLGWLMNGGATS